MVAIYTSFQHQSGGGESVNFADSNPIVSDDQNNLTDQQRLIILIIAVSLFFITLLITICIVSPVCYISKLIKKCSPKSKSTDQVSGQMIKQYISPETKSFQLTVVPQYIEKQQKNLDLNLTKNDKLNLLNSSQQPINLYNNTLNEQHLKRKLLKDIFQNKEINCNTFFLNNKNLDVEDAYEKWPNDEKQSQYNSLIYGLNGQMNNNSFNNSFNSNTNNNNVDQMEIIISVRTEKVNTNGKGSSNNNLRLVLHLKQIKYLPLKSNGLEPSFYCTISCLSTSSAFRKATNRKSSAKLNSLLYYESEIFKPRTLSPMLNLKYSSEELTKSVLKDAKLQIRIMAVEKHANDHCLGELMINLKQVLSDEKSTEKNSFNEKEELFKCYKLLRPKEIKGEVLLSVCYLPTSRRATFSISKANLNNQLNIIDFNQNYFVRVIMCCNNKIIKKKKTCSSSKLDWMENETLTFDLTNLNEYQLEQLCFLVVLACTQDTISESVSSPSSPDSPVDHTNGYSSFMKQNNIDELKEKVDKNNLQKKDSVAIGHWMLTNEIWTQVTHEPRKQIRKWVKLQ